MGRHSISARAPVGEQLGQSGLGGGPVLSGPPPPSTGEGSGVGGGAPAPRRVLLPRLGEVGGGSPKGVPRGMQFFAPPRATPATAARTNRRRVSLCRLAGVVSGSAAAVSW